MVSKIDPKIVMEYDGLWRILRFKDIEPLDAGIISCETLHDKTSTKLLVTEPVITVISPIQDQECIEGGTVSFQLQLSHTLRQNVPINWMLNARPVFDDRQKIQISALPNGNYSMTMRELSKIDCGTINFVAGKIRLTAKLNVKLPAVKLIKDLQPVDCHVGECAILFTEVNHVDHKVGSIVKCKKKINRQKVKLSMSKFRKGSGTKLAKIIFAF